LIDQSIRVLTKDGTCAIIFGSAGMAGFAKGVQEGLSTEGIANVPVINPSIVAWKIAEALADMRLSYHRRTYLAAPGKGSTDAVRRA
jgi:Asp/Glu/hydantoin racemase